MFQRTRHTVARVLAHWFGCGLVPIAPGTAGTLGALPIYFAIRGKGPIAIALSAGVCTAIGVWAASIVVDETGAKDPQFIVIDEVAGVLVALTAAPPTLLGLTAAVVMFRVFDVLKPWPASWAEEHLTAGFGVVFDDVFAGGWAALGVLGLRRAGLL